MLVLFLWFSFIIIHVCKKFRISIVLPNLYGGGAERLHVNLAKHWIDKGHSVEFLLMRSCGELLSEIPTEIKVVDLMSGNIRQVVVPLSKAIKKSKPDIILSAMWPLTVATIVAWMISGKVGRLFLSEHIVLSIECKRNLNIPLVFMKLSIKALYHFSSGIIAVSQGVKEDLCRIGSLSKDKVKVIYNPISIGFSNNRENKVPTELQYGEFDYNILTVGSFKKQKDHRTLLKAFSLMPENINARLIILGDGPLRNNLEKLIIELEISKKVLLPGFFIDPYPWYINSDLFVLSSQWEGFGNVIVEALECGLPVVSTNCPSGPSEILDNGRYGALVSVGSPIELASEMESALLKSHDHLMLRDRAKHYSIPIISEKYLNYFSEEL